MNIQVYQWNRTESLEVDPSSYEIFKVVFQVTETKKEF